MNHLDIIGKSVPRKEALEKVTGAATYTNDYIEVGVLHAKMTTSIYAHAKIKSIDTSEAWKVPGVRAIVTGKQFPYLTGAPLEDRPPIAVDKVRYYGEPVAVVVADHEFQAKRAAEMIKVEYERLPVVNSPSEAIKSTAPLVHENLGQYRHFGDVYPEANTNIANRTKIRKGNMEKGWLESEVMVEATFSFPQSDHAAMETRCARAEILPDGRTIIYSASQSPFIIKRSISRYFNISPGKIIVHTPLVGGAFGGKVAVQLELIAYLASRAVGGRMVKLVNTREEDFVTSPVHIGLDASVKLGCTKNGKITAAEITYLFDSGAYSDRAAIISKAAAVGCTGPYSIENVWCDSLCMYTNHPYATAFRGFGHSEFTFVIERTMDLLANKLTMDPLALRLKNAIAPGDTSPTQVPLNASKIGDLPKCIEKLYRLINWDEGQRIEIGKNKYRAKGIGCFWKTSNTPTDAGSGAVLTFNIDGSINLSCGVVEIGQGTKTALAQIVAERMKMDVNYIHVMMEVNTEANPEHWKTAASRSLFMAGRAVLAAADDAIQQLYRTASIVLRCSPEDLEVGAGRIFLKANPSIGIEINEIAYGYVYPNGNSIGGQVIGRGNYIMKHLTELDPNTGKGNPGPDWTVGVQAIEVEFDTKEYTYKIIRAASVIDAGKVINKNLAYGQVTGGMCLGLSFASREAFSFSNTGIIQNQQLRTYKIMRLGENPEYLVDFVETPTSEGPYGLRGLGEMGVIGIPAALANSLSAAAGVALNQLPLTPELIWKTKKGDQRDRI
ncbi:xanthine dehydrogenase family protein molybdopterin-binding subunit [Aneurinibacillus uraniidurans]|uniref:xanthine dehydrogenase family protein molybdopterin-binding subunit n=1 Tax=Aneurinibacillus uraniidurans TaxID=2966586 RepID=UPI002349235E|nr:xanthine dehydrogenase family protein molybdopterin-binding subunit [Aneurinibacillus sp. B1]WCN36279.1 xanthine dehydrogenase family protein molybdopterin-binding subunit [Aneurinibacillus sp. B1]